MTIVSWRCGHAHRTTAAAERCGRKDSAAPYRTEGSVRGGCGHAHRTTAAAERCIRRDQDGCRSQGGYSDRVILDAAGQMVN